MRIHEYEGINNIAEYASFI
ncbi:antirestriction protein ArdA, partial [Legionella pneumophila]|nr:antirestriction protein ArdA [Legionella pneumophila]